mgnify:CR=1 FL=1
MFRLERCAARVPRELRHVPRARAVLCELAVTQRRLCLCRPQGTGNLHQGLEFQDGVHKQGVGRIWDKRFAHGALHSGRQRLVLPAGQRHGRAHTAHPRRLFTQDSCRRFLRNFGAAHCIPATNRPRFALCADSVFSGVLLAFQGRNESSSTDHRSQAWRLAAAGVWYVLGACESSW